jgi:antitoxin component HigA of HigAB toxin-antitoxin module
MEANCLKQKDLAPFFGSASAVSEVLLGKREFE